MAGFYNLDHKEVIRVKVKKCDGRMQPEYKKFSIDPQITSFEMLQGILARAFDINSDFTISYLARDSEGQAIYLSMLSDWDMDAAFQCAADPCLKLKVDLRPFEEEMEDWDVIAPVEIPHHRISNLLDKNSILGSITGTITHNLGRTVTSMQRAMGLKQPENDVIKQLKVPMSDMEFHNYLDSAGFMIKPNEFRLAIYQGGIEPSLRRVAWRHLLNIYPANMSGKDRFDYMKHKEEEYRKLRDEWREKFRNNTATEEVKYVASMVKKDVLRTDRSHGFYAGNDENENTLSLFHILVTYALTHPDVSYCQGMSDLASPLLVTQKDEGQAYVCFCALMNRLRGNFTSEGNAMMSKFRHLSDLLYVYDPVLHAYLAQNSAGDMFFCYRWLLLELKREFPFTDALYVLEVMWATLPPKPPDYELVLVDPDYSSRLLSSSPCSPTLSFQQTIYSKLLAMRRVGALQRVAQSTTLSGTSSAQTTASTLNIQASPRIGGLKTVASFDTSPGDGEDKGADFPEVDNPMTRSLQQKSNSIDQVLQEGPSEGINNDRERVDNLKDEGNSLEKSFTCNGESTSSEAFTNLNDLSDTRNSTLHSEHRSNSYPSRESSLEQIPTNGTSRIFSSSSSCDHTSSRRSSSMDSVSSANSATPDQQTQFSFSLDSNTNNSTDILNMITDQENGINTFGSEAKKDDTLLAKSEFQNSDFSNSDSNAGIFQSMKRFLSSPKRRPFNNTVQDTNGSPVTSPKRSPLLAIKHTSAASISGTEKADEVVKNLSDSHISDFQDGTETFESSGTNTNPVIKTAGRDLSKLPPPHEFGAGNPFLMFVSLTLLIQHRETIISQGMCYEEIAMHFDRLVRRHNAQRVLHHARQMYAEYLRAQQVNMEREKGEMGPSC